MNVNIPGWQGGLGQGGKFEDVTAQLSLSMSLIVDGVEVRVMAGQEALLQYTIPWGRFLVMLTQAMPVDLSNGR